MKKTLRRISAAVVAAAMIFSLLPYSGNTVRADNKPLVPGTYIAAGHGYRPGNGTSSNEYLPMEGESKDWFKASGDLSECISYYQTPGADSANNSWHTSANDCFYLFYITHEKWSWASGWAYGSGFNDVERGYYVDAPGGGGEYQLYFASFDNDHIILSFPMEDRGAPYGVKVLEGDGTQADPARFALVFSEPHVIGLTASAGGSAVVDVEGEGSNASAADNEKVYVRLTPDEGYAVSSVTYTPSGGSPVALTKEDNNLYSFTMPATAVTVNASFTAGHTVRFVNNNGTDDTVWHITDGETLTVPADPAASGKLFAGWYTDPQFEPSSFVDVKNNAPAVTSDMVFYARYADDLAPVWDGKTISWTPRDPSVDPGHIEINLYALDDGEFYRFYTIEDVDDHQVPVICSNM
ncbi:MAG: InlB B-repeat-containing protein [Clostridiales bacterium]|nr:InlB B-repeat-containing protein [Clostridiales bacterium]